MTTKKTALLLILDGWGHREQTDSNAIDAARSPTWDALWANRPHTLIRTSGKAVGLPAEQMGNSEVGHMNLGAGRVVHQSLTRIDQNIDDGGFFENSVLCAGVEKTINNNSALHVFGLLSPGGIHSHENQIMALLELAVMKGADKVYLHAFLDGRDTPPRSALPSLAKADQFLKSAGIGRVASICGRFYAMDRDNRWDRVQPAYELVTEAKAEFSYDNVNAALDAAYAREEGDEFVQATLVGEAGAVSARVNDDDVVIFMNFRADRARELSRAFVDDDFDGFERAARPALGDFIMLTQYAANIDTPCAYPPQVLSNVLGEYLSAQGKTQLRIAETEKYAHVTFFFDGGREEPFAGEDRVLIPSPQVKTYDLKPEMSAFEVTDRLVDAIYAGNYDAIICNYANSDMVGHTGKFDAAVKAIEALDNCLGKLYDAAKSIGGELLITADHGNAEKMRDRETNQPHTAHTTNLVPLIYVGRPAQMSKTGSLADVIPTLLHLSKVKKPTEMTGETLAIETDPRIESLPTKEA